MKPARKLEEHKWRGQAFVLLNTVKLELLKASSPYLHQRDKRGRRRERDMDFNVCLTMFILHSFVMCQI